MLSISHSSLFLLASDEPNPSSDFFESEELNDECFLPLSDLLKGLGILCFSTISYFLLIGVVVGVLFSRRSDILIVGGLEIICFSEGVVERIELICLLDGVVEGLELICLRDGVVEGLELICIRNGVVEWLELVCFCDGVSLVDLLKPTLSISAEPEVDNPFPFTDFLELLLSSSLLLRLDRVSFAILKD